ncbi:Transcription factor IBH [Heracleum sosnowskyi]|uniref:Transcription factor IBH n=1 Tax=Heracleum sosnowskyi TaxID=360622 RepID=A0AAD8GRX4_9APIA|nr:Transcription factor IBH [Heracleum sosnowskyi]
MNPTSLNPKNNYSIKTRFTYRFLRTLKQVNTRYIAGRSSSGTARRSLEIKHAANMCMAATVGSKRAWSRAMLLKIRRRREMRRRSILSVDRFDKVKIRNPRRIHRRNGEISETEELREIVPGGEGLDTKRLLEETAHYIKCLTTQVEEGSQQSCKKSKHLDNLFVLNQSLDIHRDIVGGRFDRLTQGPALLAGLVTIV